MLMAEKQAGDKTFNRRKFLKGAAYAAPLVVGFTLVGTEVASALGIPGNSTAHKPPYRPHRPGINLEDADPDGGGPRTRGRGGM